MKTLFALGARFLEHFYWIWLGLLVALASVGVLNLLLPQI